MYIAVQSIEYDKSWLISPDGKIKNLSEKELKQLCPLRPRYNIGFDRFQNDSIQGVYLALSEEALKNVLEYQNYQYLGTYDLLLTFNHEMFHQLEQDKNWASPDQIANRSRNPGFERTAARIARYQIYRQLLEAYSAETIEQRDSLILQLLSNYQHYKETYPEDYKAAKYFDRIEGTAHYYEMISSLYSAYPQQVHSTETLQNALKTFAQNNGIKPYEAPGVDNESYVLGAWTGFLLNEIQEDNSQWKNEIMQHPDLTPLDILAEIYEDQPLPSPTEPTKATEENVKAAIQEINDKKTAPGIFRMLYQLVF